MDLCINIEGQQAQVFDISIERKLWSDFIKSLKVFIHFSVFIYGKSKDKFFFIEFEYGCGICKSNDEKWNEYLVLFFMCRVWAIW